MTEAKRIQTEIQAAWSTVLDLLGTGELERLEQAGTAALLEQLQSYEELRQPERLRQLSSNWRRWDLRCAPPWTAPDGRETVVATAGPEGKEHRFTFVRTAGGWMLDRWEPGL
ncbi:hypothetical protein [Geobacter sp.]|uniref:hypothetical protein n=1 Tax=Geobacter sp. TaxID=46610 RepID=UPI002611FE1F|nr:hypothetical protein [Geobacter sp.]